MYIATDKNNIVRFTLAKLPDYDDKENINNARLTYISGTERLFSKVKTKKLTYTEYKKELPADFK